MIAYNNLLTPTSPNVLPAVLAVAVASVISHNTSASDTVIDGEFNDSDWSVELTVGAGTATIARETTGGNPDAYRKATVGNDTALAGVVSIYQPFSFNPACQGTLNTVTHEFDKQSAGGLAPFGAGTHVELVALQDGNLRGGGGVVTDQTTWTAESRTVGIASGAINSGYTGGASGATGNIDPSGGPIQFGYGVYVSSNSISEAWIDNWGVTLNHDSAPEYNVGGSVTGLSGSVTLQNNGGDDLVLSADGAFTGFSTGMTCGAAYNVTVAAQPTGQLCTVSNGAGSVADPTPADISDVSVSCVTATPELTLVTTITSGDPYAAAGDSVSYSYTVTNSGNVALAGPVSITDDTVTGVSCPAVTTVGNNDANLDPSEVLVCSGTYTVTQADVDAGSLTNSATASADGTTSAASGATGTAAPPPPAAPATPVPVAGLWALILTTLSVVFMGGVASRRRRAR